jgi:hypothetical protein
MSATQDTSVVQAPNVPPISPAPARGEARKGARGLSQDLSERHGDSLVQDGAAKEELPRWAWICCLGFFWLWVEDDGIIDDACVLEAREFGLWSLNSNGGSLIGFFNILRETGGRECTFVVVSIQIYLLLGKSDPISCTNVYSIKETGDLLGRTELQELRDHQCRSKICITIERIHSLEKDRQANGYSSSS